MTRFVIGPDVALLLAEGRATLPAHRRLLAPTLLRSQVLAMLYAQVRAGTLDDREASQRLDHLRRMSIRLLGDRVLQQTAWSMATSMAWPDTFVAEYLASTKLQGDALVVRDEALAHEAARLVPVVGIDALEATMR